jgi:hypothetical protein
MRHEIRRGGLHIFALIGSLLLCSGLHAQAPKPEPGGGATVPRLVNFFGRAVDEQGKTIVGAAGISFAIYKDQSEGAPLWMETQNVHADAKGDYSAQLGASKTEGLPLEIFSSTEARWLGVRINGGTEQPRVLLLSVPYALKAADAQTLGGLPPSAFLLAAGSASAATNATEESVTPQALPAGTKPVTTAGGTATALARFDATADIANSQIFDTGTNVGIGTSTPKTKLDVQGSGTFHGALTLPATGAATQTAGKNSQPLNVTASTFNSGTAKAVNETFRWQVEPRGNNTTNPSGTLNLLFGSGSNVPSETGLLVSNKGFISFAPGQTFPGTGDGTVTSVGLSAPNSDFSVSGSPVTSSGTLAFNWLIPPTSGGIGNAIVKRDGNGDFSTRVMAAIGITTTSIQSTGSATGPFSATMVGINQASGALNGFGVFGDSFSGNGAGVLAAAEGGGIGVFGQAGFHNLGGQGVFGESFGTQVSPNGFGPDGVDGISHSTLGSGVAAVNTTTGDGLFAQSTGGFAAFFLGDVDVDGNLSKAGGSFKIDHPLDPANKYLYHSFVESPDMMNIYNGTVTTDARGNATVAMPEWFEALNRDFHYQLTCIGGFAPVYVAQEITENQFRIAGGAPGMKVSWQVTGVRHDAWADAHRIPVEQLKTGREQGLYLHPELFGASPEKSIAAAHHVVVKATREGGQQGSPIK